MARPEWIWWKGGERARVVDDWLVSGAAKRVLADAVEVSLEHPNAGACDGSELVAASEGLSWTRRAFVTTGHVRSLLSLLLIFASACNPHRGRPNLSRP
jgi:hypothetical protein